MKYELLNNEIYIADRIVLTKGEKKLFRCFTTFKELSMTELCIALKRIPTTFVLQVMHNLDKKLNFYYTIVRCRPPEGDIDIYYKIKRRR